MKRLKLFCVVASLLLCVGQSALAHHLKPHKIIGITPLIEVKADGSNVDADFRPYLDAFGVISIGSTSCSGTHIGNGYVLTAGHCFLTPSDTTIPGTVVTNKSCNGVTVSWSYRGSPATGSARPYISLTSNCTKVIYAERSPNRDFALFQVDHIPTVSIPVQSESAESPAGTTITLFGYPEQSPLNWSQYCSIVTLAQVPDLNKQFATGRFLYQCDTQTGSSGSAILTVNNSGVSLIGVHNDAAPPSFPYNVGTDLFDIQQTLLGRGFDLMSAISNSISNWEGFW